MNQVTTFAGKTIAKSKHVNDSHLLLVFTDGTYASIEAEPYYDSSAVLRTDRELNKTSYALERYQGLFPDDVIAKWKAEDDEHRARLQAASVAHKMETYQRLKKELGL